MGIGSIAGYEMMHLLYTDCWGELYAARRQPEVEPVLLRLFPQPLGISDRAWEVVFAELRVMARIDHPGVARIIDWGQHNGRYYTVYVQPEGTPLSDLLSSPIGVQQAADLLSGLTTSLEAARVWGVVHLGLGPTNVWAAPGGKTVVSDFGLWYAAREVPGIFEGTVAYPAPEQVSQLRAGPASDVWAVARLFLDLAFGEEEAEAALAAGCLPPGLDERQAGEIRNALQVEPLARHLNVGEFAQAMGLPIDESVAEFINCPVCRLEQEMNLYGAKRKRAGDGITIDDDPTELREHGKRRREVEQPPVETATGGWNTGFWVSAIALAAIVLYLWVQAFS